MKAGSVLGLVLACTFVGMCSGCASALRVRSGVPNGAECKTRELAGLPFYLKTGAAERRTVYERTWHRAVLEHRLLYPVDKKPNDPPREVLEARTTRLVPMNRLGLLRAFEADLARSADNPGAIPDLIKQFQGLPEAQESDSATMVENERRTVAIVDYDTMYYVNAAAPWFGSANLKADLAPDGTLTKVDATVTQPEASAVAELVPLKAVLGKMFTGAAAYAGTSPPPSKLVLSQELDGVRYVYSSIARRGVVDEYADKPIPHGTTTVNVVRQPLRPSAPPAAPAPPAAGRPPAPPSAAD